MTDGLSVGLHDSIVKLEHLQLHLESFNQAFGLDCSALVYYELSLELLVCAVVLDDLHLLDELFLYVRLITLPVLMGLFTLS